MATVVPLPPDAIYNALHSALVLRLRGIPFTSDAISAAANAAVLDLRSAAVGDAVGAALTRALPSLKEIGLAHTPSDVGHALVYVLFDLPDDARDLLLRRAWQDANGKAAPPWPMHVRLYDSTAGDATKFAAKLAQRHGPALLRWAGSAVGELLNKRRKAGG